MNAARFAALARAQRRAILRGLRALRAAHWTLGEAQSADGTWSAWADSGAVRLEVTGRSSRTDAWAHLVACIPAEL